MRYVVSLIALALMVIWVVGTPSGPVGSALSKTRGSVDPRVAERSEFLRTSERRVRYAVHRAFAAFEPIVEIENFEGGVHVHVPIFAFEDSLLAEEIHGALERVFRDAPGQRLRAQVPTTVENELKLQLWRGLDKAALNAAIPPTSYRVDDWPNAVPGPGGDVVALIFTSGDPGRAQTGY